MANWLRSYPSRLHTHFCSRFQDWILEYIIKAQRSMSEATKIEPSREKQNCERIKKALLSDSPILVFLKKSLKYLNSGLDASDIRCEPCDETSSGGYVPGKGIVLCENRLYSRKMAENTIAHEMIHMFDDGRFHVNWNDLRHHACSEIRASSLSGECRWTKELFYGNIDTFRKHHQHCVKRRAALSVQGNPNCQSKHQAEMIVQEVFASCFRDTRPFEKIY